MSAYLKHLCNLVIAIHEIPCPALVHMMCRYLQLAILQAKGGTAIGTKIMTFGAPTLLEAMAAASQVMCEIHL